MSNDILFFPIITKTTDDLDQVDETIAYTRQVFCEKKSVPQSEFFQAGQSGFKASYVLIVNIFDYQSESKLMYKNKVYDVYRTYERNDERIELYCEVKSGV